MNRAYFAWRMFEEEHLRANHRRKEARMRDIMNPLDLPEAEFRRRYRLSKDAFTFLSEELREHTDLRSSQRVSRDLKILTALSFYQSGSYQRGVGEGRHLAQQTVSGYVNEVTAALNHPRIIRRLITFPTTPEARETIKQRFYVKYGVPGVIGAIDGSHIRICTPPREVEHLYYCRKHYHSINVQMVCDSNCRILAVNPKYGGAAHDAFIWENSQVNTYMQGLHRAGEMCWLLGDSGYPLRPWLMTPIINPPAGSPEAAYTTMHGRSRVVIENTFGRLKNRWRCCIGDRALHYAPKKCAEIVKACCVLHNIAIDFYVPEPEDEHPMIEEFHRNEIIQEVPGLTDLQRGQALRNDLIRRLRI